MNQLRKIHVLLAAAVLLVSHRDSTAADRGASVVMLSEPHSIVRKQGTIISIEPSKRKSRNKIVVVTFQADGEEQLYQVEVLDIPKKVKRSVVGKGATYVITLTSDDLQQAGVGSPRVIRIFQDAFEVIPEKK